jgi:phosphoglycolate phosphatase
MKFKTILFDLDGTLTDPKIGITSAVQYALKHYGIQVDDLDLLEPFIGPPLDESFRDFYGFSQKDSVEAIEVYREYFGDRGLFENEVYPGIADMLEVLKTSGKTLILATSKPTEFAVRILNHFHLDHYFDQIVGSTFDGSRSAKADVIAHAGSLHAFDPASTVMVGDRKHDLIGARLQGLAAIGVSYGYGSMEELENENPLAIADSPEDLLKLLMA